MTYGALAGRAWLLYLAGALALNVAYVFGPLNFGPVFNLVGASAVIAIVVGARRNARGDRLPWYLFAFGQATFVAGDVLAYNYTALFGGELPFPSVADAAYLCVFPSLIVGLVLLIRRRSPGRDAASLIDALIVTVGVGALSWVTLIAPVAADAELPLVVKLVSILYPLGDLLLMGVVVRLVVGTGHRPATFYLLGSGIAALLLTDGFYGYLQLHGLFETGNWLDGGWMVFYALLGAAALHPSMSHVAKTVPDPEIRLTPRRLLMLCAAILLAPGSLAARSVLGQGTDELVLIGASIVLSVLVIARMAGIVRRHETATERETALREAGEALAGVRTPEAMDAVILDVARRVAGVPCEARLYLVTDDDARLAAVAATDVEPESLPTVERAALRATLAVRANGPGTVTIASDEAREGLSQALIGTDSRSACLAPLLLRDELHGVLAVFGPSPPLPTAQEGLAALAAQVALAVESVALTKDLISREARFSSLVRHASDVVTVIDPDTTITYVSESVERVLGHPPDRLLRTRFADLLQPDDAAQVLPFLDSAARDFESLEFRLRHADGTWRHVQTVKTDLRDDPSVAGIVLTTRDVSERKQLAHRAFHDTVTELPNRALFRNRVEQALARQLGSDHPLAVLFLDLDEFKMINDSLGHAAGDALLRDVAERLRECICSGDTVARLGGDEFAILLEGIDREVQAPEVAERMLATLEAPFALEGRSVCVHASVGIALSDDQLWGLNGVESLLRNADVAMYMAKERGKNCYRVFEAGMHPTAMSRLDLKADLQRAIQEDQFVLHYQPIIDLGTEEMIGVEALARWHHPERGLVSPDDFVPLAEETGLIVPLGLQILQTACRQAHRLQRASGRTPPLTMSVNLSARQLQSPSIVQDVRDALAASGILPSTLVLELTESVMMADPDFALGRLQELRSLGVRLAIDDFGTGYSSLNYLRQFPFDVLKVDRSFIRDIAAGGEDSALAEAIIDLAATLNLGAVAEGIEDVSQLERLRELNCGLGQGFHFFKPMTSEAVEALAVRQGVGQSLSLALASLSPT